MRDLTIMTQEPLTKDNLSDLLISHFSKLEVIDDGHDHLYLKKKKIGLEVYYLDGEKASDPDSFFDQSIISSLPNSDAYLTQVSCSSAAKAKEIVNVISEAFESTFVLDDSNWFGTAKEFLNSTHQEERDLALKKRNENLE